MPSADRPTTRSLREYLAASGLDVGKLTDRQAVAVAAVWLGEPAIATLPDGGSIEVQEEDVAGEVEAAAAAHPEGSEARRRLVAAGKSQRDFENAASVVQAALSVLRGVASDIRAGTLAVTKGRHDADAYATEIADTQARWAAEHLRHRELVRAQSAVGWGLAQVRGDLLDTGVLLPVGVGPDAEERARAVQAAIDAIGYEPDSSLAVVTPDRKEFVLGWRGDAVGYEVREMGILAEDLQHPALPEMPGLYRWDGRIEVTGDGREIDFDVEWRGRLREAVPGDLPEVGLSSLAPDRRECPEPSEPEVVALVAVARNGEGIVVGWRGEDVQREVEDVSHYVADLGIPDLPDRPGLYRWCGRIVTPDDQFDGFEVAWSGDFRPASAADVVELGLAIDGRRPEAQCADISPC